MRTLDFSRFFCFGPANWGSWIRGRCRTRWLWVWWTRYRRSGREMDAQERQRIITALEGMALVECCNGLCFRFWDSPNFFGGIPGRITLIFETNKIQGERSLSNLVWEDIWNISFSREIWCIFIGPEGREWISLNEGGEMTLIAVCKRTLRLAFLGIGVEGIQWDLVKQGHQE